MTRNSTFRRVLTQASVAAVVCFTFAAGTASVSSASPAKGTPINVMFSTQLTVGSNFPEAAGGTAAAVKEINQNGGIFGHPLQVTTCDNQNNQNLATSCAQEAVANHDVAVLAPGNVLTTTMLPILQQAGIPLIGADANSPADTTTPVSFLGAGGGYGLNNAAGAVAKELGCTKVATAIIEAPVITQVIASALTLYIKAAGLQYVGHQYAPITETNFTSTFAALKLTGANCITTAMADSQTTGLITAWKQSGSNIKLIIPGSTLAPLSSIASVDSGIYAYSPLRLPTDPAVKATVAAVEKYSPGTGLTVRSLESYQFVQLLATALKKAHPSSFTAKTTLAAMNNLTNASTGNVLAPYTTTKLLKVKAYARMFNHSFILYKVNGAKTTTVGTWTDLPGTVSPVK